MQAQRTLDSYGLLIYDSGTGALIYDSNASGGAATLSTLSKELSQTHADFALL